MAYPPAPASCWVSGATTNSLYVNVTPSVNGVPLQASIVGSNVWRGPGTFSGLRPGTTYGFYARHSVNGYHSPAISCGTGRTTIPVPSAPTSVRFYFDGYQYRADWVAPPYAVSYQYRLNWYDEYEERYYSQTESVSSNSIAVTLHTGAGLSDAWIDVRAIGVAGTSVWSARAYL